MSVIEHEKCGGTMFPSVLNRTRDSAGKVFRFQITPYGLSAPRREVVTDLVKWDDRIACDEVEPCYRLCTGMVKLEFALEGNLNRPLTLLMNCALGDSNQGAEGYSALLMCFLCGS
jgi:hypothetical protein